METENAMTCVKIDSLYCFSFSLFSVRPSIDYAVGKQLLKFLSHYTIAPVMRIIEIDEPLEIFTEMRQVVVVFINVVSKNLTTSNLIILADKINFVVHR